MESVNFTLNTTPEMFEQYLISITQDVETIPFYFTESAFVKLSPPSHLSSYKKGGYITYMEAAIPSPYKNYQGAGINFKAHDAIFFHLVQLSPAQTKVRAVVHLSIYESVKNYFFTLLEKIAVDYELKLPTLEAWQLEKQRITESLPPVASDVAERRRGVKSYFDQGESIKAIALRLSVSETTVKRDLKILGLGKNKKPKSDSS